MIILELFLNISIRLNRFTKKIKFIFNINNFFIKIIYFIMDNIIKSSFQPINFNFKLIKESFI
jgi:hypothetical protein